MQQYNRCYSYSNQQSELIWSDFCTCLYIFRQYYIQLSHYTPCVCPIDCVGHCIFYGMVQRWKFSGTIDQVIIHYRLKLHKASYIQGDIILCKLTENQVIINNLESLESTESRSPTLNTCRKLPRTRFSFHIEKPTTFEIKRNKEFNTYIAAFFLTSFLFMATTQVNLTK